jgi:hypothetical protein
VQVVLAADDAAGGNRARSLFYLDLTGGAGRVRAGDPAQTQAVSFTCCARKFDRLRWFGCFHAEAISRLRDRLGRRNR